MPEEIQNQTLPVLSEMAGPLPPEYEPLPVPEHMQQELQEELKVALIEKNGVPKHVLKKLKLPKEKWNTQRLVAVDEFGRWARPTNIAKFSLVETLQTMENVDAALIQCTSLLGDKDGKPNVSEVRLMAAKVIGDLSQAKLKLQEHLLKLSEKAHENTRSEKRKNLPPPFQLNVATQNLTVTTPANSGTAPEPEPVIEAD